MLEVSSACRASIENVFESFKFPNRGAGDLVVEARCACTRICARAAPIEPREVPLRRFQSPARLTGPFEGTFVRACTALSNRRRSTKVPFPNIPGSESWKFKSKIWVENLKRCKRVLLICRKKYVFAHYADVGIGWYGKGADLKEFTNQGNRENLGL